MKDMIRLIYIRPGWDRRCAGRKDNESAMRMKRAGRAI